MVAITLNQSLLDADLSGLPTPAVLTGVDFDFLKLDGDPDLIPKRTGTTLTITNATFNGGAIKTTGTITTTF